MKTTSLRPAYFKDLIGQKKLIDVISISVKSALSRNESMSHAVLEGPAGLGKTTLANAIANELGVDIQVSNGASIRSIAQALPYIMRIKENSIWFIDEIHRMPDIVFEFLYPIMEDFKLDLSSEGTKKQKKGEILSMKLPKFTLIGATTEVGTLPEPLRDRFKLKYTLKKYKEESICKLIDINCKKIKVKLNDEAKSMLAGASRGTPRIANSLLEWIRDYSIAKGIKSVDSANLKEALEMKDIGEDGSTENDRRYLDFLLNQDSPMGINTISASIGINRETIEQVIEPFWLAKNVIIKTTKGRLAVKNDSQSD